MTTPTLSNVTNDDDLLALDDPDFDLEAGFDVTCPGCGTRLNDDPAFSRFRICPGCARHFWLPARERIELLVDEGTFHETNAELVSVDPLIFRDSAERPAPGADSASHPYSETLITGSARIGGKEAEIAVIDFGMLGEDIGAVAGEKLVLTIEHAASRRRPLVAICSGGAGRNAVSMLSLVQSARIANSIDRLRRNGVPFIAILTHPTAGTLFSGFACHANLLFAEPGSQIGTGAVPASSQAAHIQTAEAALAAGHIDGVIDRRMLQQQMVTLLDILTSRAAPRAAALAEAPSVSALSATQEAALASHPDRPTGRDYVERLMPGFVELHGDRGGSESAATRIGLGQLDGLALAVIAIDRTRESADTDLVAVFRKASRMLRLASLLEIPVLTFVGNLDVSDTSAGVEAGAAVAQYFRTVTAVPVATVSVLTGAASGLHAMCASLADRTLMLEHAVFSPQDGEPTLGAANPRLRAGTSVRFLSSRDCRRFGFVDSVIAETGDGAHTDPQGAAQQIRLAASHAFGELAARGPRRLRDERSRKLRSLGLAGPAGTEEVRLELAHLLDIQHSVGKSLDELRGRLETHNLGLPSLPPLPPLPQRPSLPPVPLTARPNLPSIRRPTLRRPEISELAERLASTRREFSEKVSDVRSNLSESRHSMAPQADQDDPSTE